MMSPKEMGRLSLIQGAIDKVYTVREAAKRLGVSVGFKPGAKGETSPCQQFKNICPQITQISQIQERL
jgi:hypothetical protein